METVGERIKWAADRIGGLDRLAEQLPDVKRRTLTDYVSGKSEPRVSFLRDLSLITQVDPGWLVVGNMGAEQVPHDRAPIVNPSRLDLARLEHAIALIEQGLNQGRRSASPSIKAGMVSAAYEILAEADEEVAEGRILRLVKG